ncbi:HIT family protein [Paracoccaceae bacterium]|nr:HIT family protein [Paracoccaceae bacterium]
MNNLKACIFCEIATTDRVIYQTDHTFVIRDAFPVTEGHTLIIPKRHVADYFDLNPNETSDIQELLQKHKALIEVNDESVDGFNIGINVGAAAGQTVFHVHVHLIPRRIGDVENPKGGVRGVIPAKQKY